MSFISSAVAGPLDTWTYQQAPASTALVGSAFGQNTFVAIGWLSGNPAIIGTSTTGESWAPQSAPSGTYYSTGGVTYGNGLFVAVGKGSTHIGAIATSPDGYTWTPRTPPAPGGGTEVQLLSVASGSSNRFVAVGENLHPEYSPPAHTSYAIYSVGGTTWNRSYVANVGPLWGVAYGNGWFVAVGDSTIHRSTSGSAWQGVNLQGQGVPALTVFRSVTWGNNKFVAVGDNGIIVTSPDGITWSWVGPSLGSFNLYSVTFARNTFVAVGSGGRVMTSSDGASNTWTTVRQPVTGEQLDSVTYGYGSFLATGSGASGSGVVIQSGPYFQTLSVSKTGSGTGRIKSSPSGIDHTGTGTISYSFRADSVVTLTVTPDANSSFVGWSSCDNPNGNVCTMTMSSDKSVTASFTPASCINQSTPIRIARTGVKYADLQSAYNAAQSISPADTIQTHGGVTLPGAGALSISKSVILKGGYTCDFSSDQANATSITDSVDITPATCNVEFDNIALTN